jgi:hypothetical protein
MRTGSTIDTLDCARIVSIFAPGASFAITIDTRHRLSADSVAVGKRLR